MGFLSSVSKNAESQESRLPLSVARVKQWKTLLITGESFPFMLCNSVRIENSTEMTLAPVLSNELTVNSPVIDLDPKA